MQRRVQRKNWQVKCPWHAFVSSERAPERCGVDQDTTDRDCNAHTLVQHAPPFTHHCPARTTHVCVPIMRRLRALPRIRTRSGHPADPQYRRNRACRRRQDNFHRARAVLHQCNQCIWRRGYVNMHVNACVYLNMHVNVCVCVCVCLYVYIYVCMYVYLYIYVCERMRVCIYIYIYMCMYVCVYANVHVLHQCNQCIWRRE
jgi:hypothetical protein